MKQCPKCGKYQNPPSQHGHGYPPPYYYPQYPYHYPLPYYATQSTFRGKGGIVICILLIIGGIIGVLSGIFVITSELFFLSQGYIGNPVSIYLVCGIYQFMAGFIAILSAIFALKRQQWVLVIAGATLITFSYGFFFGLPALIIATIAKDEFR